VRTTIETDHATGRADDDPGDAHASTNEALDRLIPAPRRREVDAVVLALTPEEAWEAVRHTDHDDTWRDVLSGAGGAGVVAAALLTPFLRPARNHWGLSPADADATYPGDDLVPEPRWQWTHGTEVDAPAEQVWPWVAQIGADRAGFYSYQWLENLPGCDLRNAESVHPEWALEVGDDLMLHPDMPPLVVVEVSPGRSLVTRGAPAAGTDLEHGTWADVTWLFVVEPLGPDRCRVISRYRCATSDDVATRLQMGSTFLEPIGFAMDRKMLLGIKARAEQPSGLTAST